jgi:soluble cytochrome b562
MFTLSAAVRRVALSTLVATLSTAIPPLQGGTPADDKEMRDYRLTMDKVRKYVAAATAMQADAKTSQCLKETRLARRLRWMHLKRNSTTVQARPPA